MKPTVGLNIINISKEKISDICPIYVRYRNSANINSSLSDVECYLTHEFATNTTNIIAVHDGINIIGFLHYHTEQSTLSLASRIVLKALFVDREYRNQGIAKKLLNHVQNHTNISEIRVKARRTNPISPILYLNNGFTEDTEYIHLVYHKK